MKFVEEIYLIGFESDCGINGWRILMLTFSFLLFKRSIEFGFYLSAPTNLSFRIMVTQGGFDILFESFLKINIFT